MNKSMVRKLAFTLVLVLTMRTFMADYNSIGVRAESEAVVDTAGGAFDDLDFAESIAEQADDEALTDDSSTEEELTDEDKTSQEQNMEDTNGEEAKDEGSEVTDQGGQEADVQPEEANTPEDTQTPEDAQTSENTQNNDSESGQEAVTPEPANENTDNADDATVTEPENKDEADAQATNPEENNANNDEVSSETPTDETPSDDAVSDGDATVPETSDDDADATVFNRYSDLAPAVTEGDAKEQETVTDGNALYTIEIYVRGINDQYEDYPNALIRSDMSECEYAEYAEVGKSFSITPEEKTTFGHIDYHLDKTNPKNVTKIDNVVPDTDGTKNRLKLYYIADYSTASRARVAFYVLLPSEDVPDNSGVQQDFYYYPEKGKNYSYEKWAGYALHDLYSLDGLDDNNNLWDTEEVHKDNRVFNEIGYAPVTTINKDLKSNEVLKNGKRLSQYKIRDEKTGEYRPANYSDIIWYVYKNTGSGPNDKAYHIDGYIKGYKLRVLYHDGYRTGKDEETKMDPDKLSGEAYTIKKYEDVLSPRPGWKFTGWNTKPDYSGYTYTAEALAGKDPVVETLQGDLDLYAMWEPILPDTPIKIKVTLSANSEEGGKDTYVKYDGEFHRGDLNVNVKIEHQVATSPLGAGDVPMKVRDNKVSEEDKEFEVPEKSASLTLPEGAIVTASVTGLYVKGGYGEHVLPEGKGYPIILDTTDAVITLDGKEYTDKFEFEFDSDVSVAGDGNTVLTANTAIIGHLYVAPRDLELTSPSAEKIYDGTALMAKDITVGGDGFATGDYADYSEFASQTEVGSTENKFKAVLKTNNDFGKYAALGCSVDLDYKVKQTNGVLTVKENPQSKEPDNPTTPENPKTPDQPKKDTPKKDVPKKDAPKKNSNPGNDPSYDNNDSVNNNNDPAVLGAFKPLNGDDNGGAVLGSRRGATEDSTNTARLFVLIGAAAAVAILLFVGKKRKQEEN